MKLMNCMLSVLALTLASVLASCDDKDTEPKAPELGELILSTNHCAPGETVKATVKLKTEGAYYYYYRIYYQVGTVTNTIDKDDINTRKGDLEFNITAPTNTGIYTVSTHASVSFTAYDQLYGSTNTVSTTLTVEE